MKRGESTIAQGKPRSGAALGMEKKVKGVRRSEAEEADSRFAPSIVRKSLALTQIKRAPVPARSVASLRSSPLSVGLRCVAGAPSLRAQFHFFTIPKAAPLRGLPWAIILSPRFAGLKIPLASLAKFRFIGVPYQELSPYKTRCKYKPDAGAQKRVFSPSGESSMARNCAGVILPVATRCAVPTSIRTMRYMKPFP